MSGRELFNAQIFIFITNLAEMGYPAHVIPLKNP